MRGLMMDYQLTLPTILRRAETLFGDKEIISRLPDRKQHRYTYKAMASRAKKLAVALEHLGVQKGDRVATLCWNHYRHLEAYFGVPGMGAILHPLNLRLDPHDLAYIVRHAEDRLIIVDQILLPLFEKFRSALPDVPVIVVPQTDEGVPEGFQNYETLLEYAQEAKFAPYEGDEYAAAFMCYTSGTTGRPKGILYSHRSIVLHAMAFLFNCTGGGITERDVVLPVVPMFHASAWGFPYCCAFVGATQVFPGPYLDAESLLQLFQEEKVTLTGGVPTVMLGILNRLDEAPEKYALCLRTIVIGGSSAPRFMVRSFREKYGIQVLHSWGMTELSPLGSTCVITSKFDSEPTEALYDRAMKQGLPVPFVEVRGRNESGLIPWDGVTMGELEVRGPWVASSYYRQEDDTEKFTTDGWLRTGDIVSIDQDGYIEIRDRSKDVIKSGGEWISSAALENCLMEHPSVLEAAVIGIPDEKWIERPFAYIVLRQDKSASADAFTTFLEGRFARFWLPDGYQFIESIPKTSVGKFFKSALRERYHAEHLKG